MKKTEERSVVTGLTPIQEEAAIMLAKGQTIEEISDSLNLNKGELIEWTQVVTFQCFLSQQNRAFKETLRSNIFGLAEQAVRAITESLSSDNEQVKLKAATWIVDKINELNTGQPDIAVALREKHTINTFAEFNQIDEANLRKEASKLGVSSLL